MTIRDKVHRLLDELPDSEMESVLEFIVSRQEKREDAAARVRPRLGLGRSTDGLSAAEMATRPIGRPAE